MKAAQINKYGHPSVIEIAGSAQTPELKTDQVLVEVYTASINPVDRAIREGYMQKMLPLSFPVTLGGDFAGKVSQVGAGVSAFKIGDEVYGQASVFTGGSGSMAEFLAANTTNTTLKPKSLNFEQAGALPLVGVSALQALEENIKLQKDQKILIHGGAGGIGHIAIQFAKSMGAYVATTVQTKDVEFVKSLGADEVIDYKTQKFEELLQDFDAVFDTAGGQATDKSFQVVKKGGIIVSMVGQPNQELAQKYGVTAVGMGTQTDAVHLNQLSELVDAGKLKAHIDKIFPLSQARKAFTYQEEIHPQGKVVLKIKN